MVITKENIDELNAVVKVQVSPNDYNEKVEQALKSYQKRHLCLVFVQEKFPIISSKNVWEISASRRSKQIAIRLTLQIHPR